MTLLPLGARENALVALCGVSSHGEEVVGAPTARRLRTVVGLLGNRTPLGPGAF